MSSATYAEALDIIDRLDADERRKLLLDLAARLEQPPTPRRTVAEFRGVGKDNPIGMDAQEFVDQERDSWTG